MVIDEVIINKIIKTIENICHNNNIISHLKILIKENKDNITFISNNCISAKKYDEVFEVNISNNYFTIYSTSWGHTVRKKTTFFKHDNNLILTFNNDEITNDGTIFQCYVYEFTNNELKQASYTKKIKLDYNIKKENKTINREEIINIYPVGPNKAIKSLKINEKEKYYITEIKNIRPENIDMFSFIYSRMDQLIDYNNSQKILKNRR